MISFLLLGAVVKKTGELENQKQTERFALFGGLIRKKRKEKN